MVNFSDFSLSEVKTHFLFQSLYLFVLIGFIFFKSLFRGGGGGPHKPICTDRADNSLLNKCLHGKTQNKNVSFNGLIWRRIPKDQFVKLTTFEFAVHDAVTHFNIGNLASLILYDKVNIERGYYTLGCISDNETRISNSVGQSSSKLKTRRRYPRGKKYIEVTNY